MADLLEQLLAANRALRAGDDLPVPALGGMQAVAIVTCGELARAGEPSPERLVGLAAGDVFVISTAGARVSRADGEVARSVAAAAARLGVGEVVVLAHEGCSFLASASDAVRRGLPSAARVPHDALETFCGDSYVSARELARSEARTLRSSPYLPAGLHVHALVLDPNTGEVSVAESGREAAAAAAGSPDAAAAATPSAGSAPGFAGLAPGPVSFFAGEGRASLGDAPPPFAPGPTSFGAHGVEFQGLDVEPVLMPEFQAMPAPRGVEWGEVEPRSEQERDAEPPPPPPAPPAKAPPPRKAEPPRTSDDAFQRAADVLERLRMEKRRRGR